MSQPLTPETNPCVEPLSTETLFELIESKLHLLNEMHCMSISQNDLVAQHDTPELMVLLSKKQDLMESLRVVQSRLAAFESQDPEKRVWANPSRRVACREMIKRSDALLQQLIVMENRSLDNMVIQREMVAAQLQQNFDASIVQHAYHAGEGIETIDTLSIEG
ncbi:MAG: hypothetical protein ABL921_08205 [Pirellula sp.]